MNAIEVTIPEKWHFQGAMYLMAEGGTLRMRLQNRCSSSPTSVFRATSPDGLSFVEQLPSPAWGWAVGPDADMKGVNGCFPIQGPLSAKDLLKYIAAVLGVEYTSDIPVPADRVATVKKKIDDLNAAYSSFSKSGNHPTIHSSSELAWAEVRWMNGTFAMKGRLRGQVIWMERVDAAFSDSSKDKKKGPTTVESCQAILLYGSRPKQAMSHSWRSGTSRGWDRGSSMNGSAHGTQGKLIRAGIWNTVSSKMSGGADPGDRNVEYSEGRPAEDDLGIQRGLRGRPGQGGHDDAAEKSHRKEGLSQDWTDYLLHGWVEKDASLSGSEGVPSPFSRWVNSIDKEMFESKDPHSDPNGIVPGNWSKDTQSNKSAKTDSPDAGNADGIPSQQ